MKPALCHSCLEASFSRTEKMAGWRPSLKRLPLLSYELGGWSDYMVENVERYSLTLTSTGDAVEEPLSVAAGVDIVLEDEIVDTFAAAKGAEEVPTFKVGVEGKLIALAGDTFLIEERLSPEEDTRMRPRVRWASTS